jgi:hypothetical protein
VDARGALGFFSRTPDPSLQRTGDRPLEPQI